MMDVIEFLDQLGSNARLRDRLLAGAPAELERALAASGISPELRSALLAGDAPRLGELLGAQPNVCCLIVKPDPAQPDEEEEEEEEEEDTDKAFV
jgi:hypothetical protein